MRILKLTTLIFMLQVLLTSSVFAVQIEKRLTIEGFNKMVLTKGLDVEVLCAEKPLIIAKGTQSTLDKLKVDENNQQVSITGITQEPNEWEFSNHKVLLKIYTNKPIETMNITQGVELIVDACAVPTDELKIKGNMGVSFAIRGETKKLSAELAMGASFNDNVDNFKAEQANINAAMGAKANLINVKEIDGRASMGAVVYIGQHSINKLNTDMGVRVIVR